jgi:hypothetical protein
LPSPGHSEFESLAADGRIVMSAGGFAVVFNQTADRWTHSLELGLFGLGPAVQTVESAAADHAPARITSPVYQEIHRHDLAGRHGLCCLLTGLVFKHHFSAVVTLSADVAEPDTLLLDFDLADRCRGAVECIAATYLVALDSGEMATADSQRIVWAGGKLGQSRLELVAAPPTALALAEAGRRATQVQAVAQIEPGVFTHRLRYSWRWTSVSTLTR